MITASVTSTSSGTRRRHRRRALHRRSPRDFRAAWRHGLSLSLILALLIAFGLFTAPREALALTVGEAQPRALDYLHAQLRDNGGFATNSPTGDLATTPWVIMAVSAAGYDPSSWSTTTGNIVTTLRDMDVEREATQGSGANNTPAFYAKLILAFVAAGRPDLAVEAGRPAVNLAERLLTYRHPETGHFSMSTSNPRVADISTTAWAVMALAVLGSHPQEVEQAANWLKGAQADDGGFSFQSGAIEDVDDTGAAIQALLAAGVAKDDPAIRAAVAFLKEHQNQDGGFVSWVTDTKSTAESTAWALQALNAVGEDPANWTRDNDPVGYLLSLQMPQGAFAHRAMQLATPLMTTTQVVIALAGRSFPFPLAAHTPAPGYRPALVSLSPAADATVPAAGFTITAVVTDEPGGTGINPASLQVQLNDTTLTLDAEAAAQGSINAQSGAVPPGSHRIRLTFADYAGHTVTVDTAVTALPAPSASSTTTTTRPLPLPGRRPPAHPHRT